MNEESRPCFASDRPFVIGLTGNIACGKSTVVAKLAQLGATEIDADAVYHELITPGAPLWKSLVDRFGESILSPDDTINRRRLGEIVFADAGALAELDRTTHPSVVTEVERRLTEYGHGVVVVAAVKLIESGMDVLCHQVWVVTCEPEQQIERLMSRNGLNRADAELRLQAQPDVESRLRQANVIIDNSGTLADTCRQIGQAWRYHVPAAACDATS